MVSRELEYEFQDEWQVTPDSLELSNYETIDSNIEKASVRCTEEIQWENIIWRQLGGTLDRNYLTTRTKQLRVNEIENNRNRIYSPIFYQSCMHPEETCIYDLKVRKVTDTEWQIETHYQSEVINTKKVDLQVSDWEAKIHKADCKKCENCGRCSW